jgi:hypothetical protein
MNPLPTENTRQSMRPDDEINQNLRHPGVIRWESPFGDEPEFAPTLRDNPGRWAVIFEGSGPAWSASAELRWILNSDGAEGFSYRWVRLNAKGEPAPRQQFEIRLEMQGRGRAYARYDVPTEPEQEQADADR